MLSHRCHHALTPALPHQSRNVGLSCLYVGRVWHARFVPTLHKFGCVGGIIAIVIDHNHDHHTDPR